VDKPDHFLITRFNVAIPAWERDKAGMTTLDQQWMDHRMALFSNYCAPSVAGQTIHDFKWLIYCDPHTAATYIDAINKSIARVPNAEIRLVEDFDALKKDVRQVVSTGSSPYIITSRVDNDDALGKAYIQMIQTAFVTEDRTIINLCGGILYDLPNKILTRLPDMRFNHFGSLIEKRNPSETNLTVMGFSHHDPPGDVKVINVKSEYAWLKIIHERNVNSRAIGVPVFSSNVCKHFSIDKRAMTVSRYHSILYFFKRGLAVLKRKIRLDHS